MPSSSLHQILGYDVLSTLGYGARSTIYAVRDKDQHVYALKRVNRQAASDDRFVQQAVREHEVASELDHPSLRKSYKLIRQRRLLKLVEVYVLLEFVDGMTLEHHRPDNLADLCRVCRAVATALAYMHDRGYVHADIKPNNIMVADTEQVKIIDFGQSCEVGTAKPRIQGTPDYIAPEQVLRMPLTPATDVFNLGATMYWLLTNQHVPTLMPKHRPGVTLSIEDMDALTPRSPREVNPSVPPALSSLVMNCVQPRAVDRLSSMNLLCDRLELAIKQVERDAAKPAEPTRPTADKSGANNFEV